MQVMPGKNDGQNQLALQWLLRRCDGFGGINDHWWNEKGLQESKPKEEKAYIIYLLSTLEETSST